MRIRQGGLAAASVRIAERNGDAFLERQLLARTEGDLAEMYPDEASMIEPLRAAVVSGWTHDSDPWLVLTEHRADTRIPDLVLARLNEEAVAARLDAGCRRPLARPELVVMLALRRDSGTTIDKLAARTLRTQGVLRRTLRSLEGDGFVCRTSTGAWRAVVHVQPLVSRFVSFEAKRSDWRRALAQACAHRLFANEAYVAFDPSFAARFERGLGYFKTSGVGLLSLGREPNAVKRILRGHHGRPIDPVSAMLAGEEVWGRLLGLAPKPLPQTRLPGAAARIEDQAGPTLVADHSRRLGPLLSDLAQPALG